MSNLKPNRPTSNELEKDTQNEDASPSASLVFDGVDDYVAIAISERESATFSVELWVKSSRKQSNYTSIFSSCDTPPFRNTFQIDVMGGYYRFYQSDFQVRIAKVTQTWQHLAVVYDGQSVHTYADGELQYSKSIPAITAIFKTYTLGGNRRRKKFFAGQLSDLRIWDCARTEAEIKQSLSQRLIGRETGLIGYWPLNEGSGETIVDGTGSIQPATISGATWQPDLLPLQPAPTQANVQISTPHLVTAPMVEGNNVQSVLNFDGTSTTIETTSTLNFGTSAFTIEAWIYSTGSSGTILSSDRHGISPYQFRLVQQNEEIAFIFSDGPGNIQLWESQKGHSLTAKIATNEWYHVAIARLGSTHLMYIDGHLVTSIETESTIDWQNENLSLRIGAQHPHDGTGGIFYFTGNIADLRIWDRAVSIDEIQTHRYQTLSGQEPGLILYWPLNEGGDTIGDRTNNSLGTLHNGTWEEQNLLFLQPLPVDSSSGEVPAAPPPPLPHPVAKGLQIDSLMNTQPHSQAILSFDGTSSYIDTTCKLNFGTAPFTLEAWVYSTGTSGTILSSEQHGNSSYQFRLAQDGNDILFMLSDGPGNVQLLTSQSGYQLRATVIKDEWSHVAIKRVGSSHQMYINGILVSEYDTTTTIDWKNDSISLRFGAQHPYGGEGGIFYFPGKLADVRIWSIERTADEIKTGRQYALSGSETGLVGYWPLNEGGNTVGDRTGGSTATLYGGSWSSMDVYFLQSDPESTAAETTSQNTLTFDGTGSYIDTTCKLNFGTAAFTLEAWVCNTGASGVILSSDKLGKSSYQFRLAQENSDLYFALSDLPGNVQLWSSSIGYNLRAAVPKGEWFHVAVKRTDKTHQMYIDGALVAEIDTPEAINWQNTTLPLRIGAQRPYSGDGGIFYFSGQVADLRIWNIDRSAKDIQTQRYSALSGDESGLVGYWPLNEGKAKIADLTGKSETIRYGGTWQQADVPFSRPQKSSKPTKPKTTPKTPAAPPEQITIDSEFEKSVISVTVLTGSNHTGGDPVTIYGQEKRKKRKKRKKQDLSPFEKVVRDVAKRQDEATRTYLERHERSNRKKSNGWIKDFPKNYLKSISKLF